ncbi:MAG: ABC transporter ATP-binding protein [Methanoregula sp.]|jgi:peptide/nickel transport system ATP-binding protein|uniref:ABC transporter ATP-binding protein n=1 Tax=Methanoregula sp. TaxID=2052170 RepID=UPI0025D71D4B|nr:ABC transporter ATP-binding protein [Methanoregula sp.]MCK9630589.1 ABC transporter ATP-binding protein [Methanoregula sp.]
MSLLAVSNLSVQFEGRAGTVPVLDHIDLEINTGEQVALIGESGCGKTVFGMSVMRLLPSNARVTGSARYAGRDLILADEREMQQVRGKKIAMISQNSAFALNPVLTIGDQIAEPLTLHTSCRGNDLHREVIALLTSLGIERPEENMQKYPHQFSGGMRERILIAMALACNPDLIIADEPTSGLDALVKAQILELLRTVMQDRTLLLITHDLGTASALASHTAVMYAGEIVEYGPTQDLFTYPLHPYTQGLIAASPSAGFHPIPGVSPAPGQVPSGCWFCPRCSCAMDRCSTVHPSLKKTGTNRQVRCLRYD